MLYRLKIIDLKSKEQKQPWFIEVSPNGTIPALTDRSRGNFNVFETGAILLYLAHNYDKEGKFSFNEQTEEKEHNEMLQWMFFVVSHLRVLQRRDDGSPWGVRYRRDCQVLMSSVYIA